MEMTTTKEYMFALCFSNRLLPLDFTWRTEPNIERKDKIASATEELDP